MQETIYNKQKNESGLNMINKKPHTSIKDKIFFTVRLQRIAFNIGKSTAIRNIDERILQHIQQSKATDWRELHMNTPIRSQRKELNILHVIHMFSNIESSLVAEHDKVNHILSTSQGAYFFKTLKIKHKSDIPVLLQSLKEKADKTAKSHAAKKIMHLYGNPYNIFMRGDAQKTDDANFSDIKALQKLYKLPDEKFHEFVNYFNELDNTRQNIFKTQNVLKEILHIFIQKPTATWNALEMFEGTIFTCSDTINETLESGNVVFVYEEILKPLWEDIIYLQDESANMRFHSAKSRLEQEAQFLKLLRANRRTFSESKPKTLNDLLSENEKIQNTAN